MTLEFSLSLRTYQDTCIWTDGISDRALGLDIREASYVDRRIPMDARRNPDMGHALLDLRRRSRRQLAVLQRGDARRLR